MPVACVWVNEQKFLTAVSCLQGWERLWDRRGLSQCWLSDLRPNLSDRCPGGRSQGAGLSNNAQVWRETQIKEDKKQRKTALKQEHWLKSERGGGEGEKEEEDKEEEQEEGGSLGVPVLQNGSQLSCCCCWTRCFWDSHATLQTVAFPTCCCVSHSLTPRVSHR